MLSNIGAMILILQLKWRPYQVNTRTNTTSQWIMKLRVLWERRHMILFQVSQLVIKMCLQKHCLSITRGKLNGVSGSSSNNILWEGMYRRDCLLNPWTGIIQWFSGPQWGWCWFCRNYLLLKCLLSGIYSRLGDIFCLTSQGSQEWWRAMWRCYQIKEEPIWSSLSLAPMVWKFWEIVCEIDILWQSRCIPDCSCPRLWFAWYMWTIVSFGNVHNTRFIKFRSLSSRMVPVKVGNTQRESQCLSS